MCRMLSYLQVETDLNSQLLIICVWIGNLFIGGFISAGTRYIQYIIIHETCTIHKTTRAATITFWPTIYIWPMHLRPATERSVVRVQLLLGKNCCRVLQQDTSL